MAITDIQAKRAKPKEKAYKIYDEKGMYLEVSPKGGKYWRLKYRINGREKRKALGVYPDVSLKEARERRDEARKFVEVGIDPIQAKRARDAAEEESTSTSFEVISREWYAKNSPNWSSSHSSRVWRSLGTELFPHIGTTPIAQIKPTDLLTALRKVEERGALESAHRVKQVAGQVFRYGVATGRCERDIAIDLNGALASPKTRHLAAITEPEELGRLLVAIKGFTGTVTVKAALELTPLVFVRPGELRHMEWSELNWDKALWEIPENKMKTRKPHIVPLATQAIAILKAQAVISGRGRYVFPSARGASRPLSENGVRVALRTMGYSNEEVTPHGFRATARTILDEVLGYPVEWIEHQLAHEVKDSLGRAYNRTKHLPQRIEMMQKWADYLEGLQKVGIK